MSRGISEVVFTTIIVLVLLAMFLAGIASTIVP
jgi:hypothetical protein